MANATAVDLYPRARLGLGPRPNVAAAERVISVAVGGLLTYYGYQHRRRPVGWVSSAVGGLLLERGATGRCPAYGALGIDTASPKPVRIRQALQVMKPRHEVYSYWRDLTNLPKFMKHLRSIEVREGGRSHWRAEVTPGAVLEWDAVISEDRPGELISWRSVEGSAVDTAGEVRFADLSGGRGTGLLVELSYRPPAGTLGTAVARLFRGVTEQEVREDLRRFKNVIETGEIPRIAGQPSGRGRSREEPGGGDPKGVIGRVARPLRGLSPRAAGGGVL
jgi:uncharacterized membrane protein